MPGHWLSSNNQSMKILALEKELKPVNWQKESGTLIEEARSVYDLMLSGTLREIYFSENRNAVLILECDDKTVARQLVNKLPLVRKGLIDFDIIELHPYTGFSRLMNQ